MPGLVAALDSRNREQIHHRNRDRISRTGTGDTCRHWTATTPTRKQSTSTSTTPRTADSTTGTETEGKDKTMTTQDSTTSTSTTPPRLDSMTATPAEAGQHAPRKRRKDNTSAAAHNRYMEKAYDRMTLQLIKGDKVRLQAAAAALDMSPTALIIAAVNAYTAAETLTTKARNPYI